MCGPSGPSQNELALEQSSQSFSNQLQQNYGTLFAKQQDVMSALNKSLSPILAAGPSQRGFSAEENAALQTQAINSAGAANTSAQQFARTIGAGEGGGGTSGLTSGITKQIQSAIGSQAANALGGQQNQIAQADFAQGNQNYWRAQAGVNALAGEYSPNAAAGASGNENQLAFGQEGKIMEQQAQKNAFIPGLIASAIPFSGKGLAAGFANLDTTGGSTGGEQAGNFLSGALAGLAG